LGREGTQRAEMRDRRRFIRIACRRIWEISVCSGFPTDCSGIGRSRRFVDEKRNWMAQAVWFVILLCVIGCAASAQSPAAANVDEKLVFEVASVKPSAPESKMRMMGGPGSEDPGLFLAQNWPLSSLVNSAYNLVGYQVSVPGWMHTARFEIRAKVPEGTARDQFRVMLQNLLAQRFKLAVHREKREMTVYDLVVRGDHSKLKESAGAPDPSPRFHKDGFPILPVETLNGQARIDVLNESMEQFATRLSSQVPGQVTDATGLKGKYDVVLTWSLARQRATDTDESAADTGPNLFSALQEQLGLKLVPKKGMVEVLVVDHAERTPTEN
jgi:uncharacterized protein (TIGR03435 family)